MIPSALCKFRVLAVTGLVATLGCSREPALNVKQESAAPPAPAAVAAEPPAAAPAGAPGEAVASHTASIPAAMPAAGGPQELPAGHPPIGSTGTGMELAPIAPEHGRGQMSLSWQAPASWSVEPPANTMRRAQYKVPGPGGEGECVVFYFGPGQGGDAQSNAERWASQFTDANGQPATASMKTRTETVGGMQVLFVEAGGTYQAGSMMGMGQGVAKPDWALLGAIAAGPDANWFFKFTAPRSTLEANRAAFDAMIASLNKGN